MRVIWKYKVPARQRFSIEMPEGAVVLSVQVQFGEPHIWCLVDPLASKEARQFMLLPTGEQTPYLDEFGFDFRGTFQVQGGTIVLHLFEFLPMTHEPSVFRGEPCTSGGMNDPPSDLDNDQYP